MQSSQEQIREPSTPLPPPRQAAPERSRTTACTSLQLEVSALTDIGCVRSNNEDAFGYSEAHGIYVVCDGMGGSLSGEVASAAAVSTILKAFGKPVRASTSAATRLRQAIVAANAAVWQQGQTARHRGMGTTVVTAALNGAKLVIGNVGDSRAYLFEDGRCMQLTVDHSYINELIRNGTLTPESADHADLAGLQSVITRAIGAAAKVEPEFFSVDLHPQPQVLLCTDGLTRYVLPEEIGLILTRSPFEQACASLIALAKRRGGRDNITCLLLRIG